tara:strand:+ start:2091 stop:2393 length:303 start_codon:yes stop_codon:yes gene_type:complete
LIAVVINKLRPLIFGSVQQLHARMQVSAKSPTGETLKHIAKYWARLCISMTAASRCTAMPSSVGSVPSRYKEKSRSNGDNDEGNNNENDGFQIGLFKALR